jgi:hypothetical protein
MKMEQTEGFETSEYKIQTLRNYPEESIQHSKYGYSLKSIIITSCETRPMKMEQTEGLETSAHKIHKPGITQKKEYNIHNTAIFLNLQFFSCQK